MNKKLINLENCYSKAEVIAGDLKDMIGRRKLAGKLPPESVLAQKYDVNIKTANKAISRLIDMGCVYRMRGIGTFVRDDTKKQPESEYSKNTIALFMPSHGHIYEDFYNKVIKRLKEERIYPLLMNSDDNLSLPESRFLIDQVARFNCKRLLIAFLDDEVFDFDYLQTKRELFSQIIYVNCKRNRHPNEEALNIAVDHFNGVYQAVCHLQKQGCNNILFVSHEDKTYPGKSKVLEDEFYNGYCAALRDFGNEEKAMTFGESNDNPSNMRKLEEIFSGKNRPDGVFCTQDCRAIDCIKVFSDLGLRVPEDIIITGYYNTPWSEISHPKLTSVSIEEDKIANALFENVKDRKRLKGELMVTPRLVVRESTARGFRLWMFGGNGLGRYKR